MAYRCYVTKSKVFQYLLFCLIFIPGFVFGQNSDEPKEVTSTYYFENVNIVQKPGIVLPFTKMIIRNGLIADVGNHLTMPADAIKIPVDSMFIYAGFIDAFSNTGIPKTENKDTPKIQDPGNPPNDVAGITPQLSSFSFYKPEDKSNSELRSAGFTLVHTSPRGYMLPGQTCLFSLKDGQADDVLVKKDLAMVVQFNTNRSVYPSTVIGVMAKFKELYKNAEILGKNHALYEANPNGLPRPVLKKEEWALQGITQGKQSVYFQTSTPNQISRALQLQKELGFPLVLTNVKNGENFIPALQKQNARVVLSLDLPEEAKEGKKGKGEEKTITDEEKLYEEKRKKAMTAYETQASVFEKANMPFAFSCLDVKPGVIQQNLRRMIKAGLSEKTALAALTTTPAEWFGLSQMAGTVEKGKWANLLISDTTIFHEKAKIKWVLVEGKMFENKIQEKKDKPSDESSQWSGKWSFTVEIEGETYTGSMNIVGKNEVSEIYVIIDDFPNQKDKATDIRQKGNQLMFTLASQNLTGSVTYEVDITLDKSSFSGTVSMPNMGSFPISGDKKVNPNE